MFDTFTEHERNWLIKPCEFFAGKIETAVASIIIRKIIDVFYQWKSEQADKNGMVEVRVFDGVLSDPASRPDNASSLVELLEGRIKRVPEEDVAPWQCAGPTVTNDIDLAFKLWFDKYQPFNALLKEAGLFVVFSVIGLYSQKENIHSLIQLNNLLVNGLTEIAGAEKFIREKANVDSKHWRNKGTEKTKYNKTAFQMNLSKFVDEKHTQMSIEKMTDAICNTGKNSDAVIWEHGEEFKGRPWNAKNHRNDSFKRDGVIKRVTKAKSESLKRRLAVYGKKKA